MKEILAYFPSYFITAALLKNQASAALDAPLSSNRQRNKIYAATLARSQQAHLTIPELITVGHHLMRKAKLHPHFFGNNSLRDTAQFLAFYALGLPSDGDYEKYVSYSLKPQETLKIIELYEQRIARRIPVEYLTQEATYLGNSFYVNEQVLVPRSLMNTRFRDFLSEVPWSNKRVLDLCTGSGCIGITLALLKPDLQVDLLDISEAALQVAEVNIQRYGLSDRVTCIQSHLFDRVTQRYDLIISNPPYVTVDDYKRGPLEFKNEPKLAFESGKDGLEHVREILSKAKDYLNPEGRLIVEVGFPAAKRIKRKYPLPLKWYTYRKASGKTAFLAMDCVFLCEAKNLPSADYFQKPWISRWLFRGGRECVSSRHAFSRDPVPLKSLDPD